MCKRSNPAWPGATVFRGYMGYGAASGLNTGKILRSSRDLPIIIEILDTENKVNAFMEVLDQLLTGGVAIIERVNMIRYRRKPKSSAHASKEQKPAEPQK